ncbi:MAG: hypothetical protein Ct9H300mP25_11370 [Acidobacteriota bacterium]|nr:MAG: hypothetical protein Ct9H300mP25_11370 [Acidobacteriota bacterium]
MDRKPLVTAASPKRQESKGRNILDFFLINKGPWSRLEENKPFVPGVPEKPAGAGYYPTDSTREEIATWIDGLSDNDRREATGFLRLFDAMQMVHFRQYRITWNTKGHLNWLRCTCVKPRHSLPSPH